MYMFFFAQREPVLTLQYQAPHGEVTGIILKFFGTTQHKLGLNLLSSN